MIWRVESDLVAMVRERGLETLFLCGYSVFVQVVPINSCLYKEWVFLLFKGPSWLWSYDSWIYNYLCILCLSPLKLWVRIPLRRGVQVIKFVSDLRQVGGFLRALRFSPPIKLTDITEILWKVVLSTISLNIIILFNRHISRHSGCKKMSYYFPLKE
jgi:hypothetical protein